ncbi:MAG: MATE family efflux transporter [Clostridiales bacterium]|nr:MATE family efflux transporter [Clostridiales bacterium]
MNIQLSDHFNYRRLFRFTLPSIVMMIFISIYGVVDGLFVSNFVGKTPFAAINLVMPFIMILGGVGFMIGTGGSALVSKTMGQNEPEKANRIFSMMIELTLLVGALLSIVGIVFIEPIARLFGASEAMLPECVLYGRIVLSFNAAFMLQNVFQAFLVTAERPHMGLYVTVAAGVTNMALDALFIAVFKWGVAGAAIATGLSQCVGGLIPLIYFMRPNKSPLRLKLAALQLPPILQACANGSSELMSNISGSLVSIAYNAQLMKYAGENGVAAYGVLMYVQFIFVAIDVGYAVGCAPIVGYHYGAQNHGELKNMLRKSLFLMSISGVMLTLLAAALAAPLARLFVGYDQALFDMTRHAFRLFSLSFLLAGINIYVSSFFTALNNGAVSAIVSFLRTLVFQMLCVLVLPIFFGIDGIWWAMAVAEVFAFILSLSFLIVKRNKYHYM